MPKVAKSTAIPVVPYNVNQRTEKRKKEKEYLENVPFAVLFSLYRKYGLEEGQSYIKKNVRGGSIWGQSAFESELAEYTHTENLFVLLEEFVENGMITSAMQNNYSLTFFHPCSDDTDDLKRDWIQIDLIDGKSAIDGIQSFMILNEFRNLNSAEKAAWVKNKKETPQWIMEEEKQEK